MKPTNKQIFESIGFFDQYLPSEKGINGSYHATKFVNIKRKTFMNRNEFGNVYLFISSQMYPNTKKNFVYATLYQINNFTPYRCRISHVLEVNKQFFSAKTQRELLLQIKHKANFDKFVIV